MCCFSGKVESVEETQIFARLSASGTQFLVYQMKYESKTPNAMILPLPVKTPAKEKSVRFIDLSKYDRFFKDLNRGFPRKPVPPSRAIDSELPLALNGFKKKLVVHEVGNFVASFVPTVDDFGRLDPQFVIPKETWQKIPGYADFGFAVFQLKEGAGKPHPMAFEFATKSKEIFFPTVHIHDGEVHAREEFDHVLYMQHAGFDTLAGAYQDSRRYDKSTGLIRSKRPANAFCQVAKTKGIVNGDLLVHRDFKHGRLKNEDMTYAVKGHPDKPGARLGSLGRISTILLASSIFSWFISRRDRIRAKKTVGS